MGGSDGRSAEQFNQQFNHMLAQKERELKESAALAEKLEKQQTEACRANRKRLRLREEEKRARLEAKALQDFEIIKKNNMQFCVCKKCFSNYTVACLANQTLRIGHSYDHVAERSTVSDPKSKL